MMGAKGNGEKKMKKKKRAAGPNVVAMKHKASAATNPFESIWSRSKFHVLGKKRKGEERRIGMARSLAIDKRKKTLLKEYERSGKASAFVDKRIGELNDDLEEFDKAILRSQRERQMTLSKKRKYKLSDGDEDEADFGFEGGLLGQDDFQDDMEPEEEEDNDPSKKFANLKQISSVDHEEEEDFRHKSKKEVMEEIISKSKYHKELNRKAKEDNEQLMEQLDQEFETLVQSEALLSLTRPNQMANTTTIVADNIPNGQIKKDEPFSSLRENITAQAKPDAYEKILKTMQLEMRARPSDRIKTSEELAREEKERLEKLEEKRRERMLAIDDSSDDELGHEDVKLATQKPKSISGDDLGDSFDINDEETKMGWVDEILQRNESGDNGSENGESSQDTETDVDDSDEEDEDDDDDDDGSREDNENYLSSVSFKDWEQENDDVVAATDNDDKNVVSDYGQEVREERDHGGDGREQDGNIMSRSKKLSEHSMGDENYLSVQFESLPYTIEAPASFEELSKLLQDRSDADIIEAIKRIRKCNAIALKAENRKKMQVFYGLLLQYFAISASRRPFKFDLLNALASPLVEMSVEIPYFSAICARERIMRTRMQLCDALKNRDRSCWPSTKTLFLLRLWSMVYPCSDFRHVVMTPATLLMCEYLMRCPITSGYDITIGMFLCSMVLYVAKLSRKLYPEALMFIRTLLMAAINKRIVSDEDSQLYFLVELKAPEPLLFSNDRSTELTPLDFFMIMELPEDSSFFSSDSFRAGIMISLVETLGGFIEVYESFSSFPELFLPISKLMIEAANGENMPGEMQDKLKELAKLINRKAQGHYVLRQPLQMQKQKPLPIKLVNPKFEENFVKGRDYDPDRERSEARRLKKQIKQEAKGAVRELRKDNFFLFEVKEKEKTLNEEERTEKYGKAKAFLQEQEHAFKSGQLGKGGKRRR
uniref:Nucleolar protein 14 n=1 Tax=Kalanchoe fedtschenkoi TaxID=63787 RepID=A0A7N0U7V8_KALFE